MVYFSKMVVALKINGKFVREQDSVVKIPFGSEYNLFLKNLNSRDALVKINIDGSDVLDGNQIIVRANSSIELEGFMQGNKVKNKFKFIEITKEIEEYRGIKGEDSLIRIEVRYEKEKPIFRPHYDIWYTGTWNVHDSSYTWEGNDDNVTYTKTSSIGGCSSRNEPAVFSCLTSNVNNSDLGFTAMGSETYQQFHNAYIGDLEENSYVHIIKLSGYHENKDKVKQVITTKTKLICSSCGLQSSSENKYCPRCGTFLS